VSATLANSSSPTSRPLRAWQRRALQAYRDADPADFLVTATPGSGKTAYALTLARMLLDSRAVDRVVVVCPTDHLRTQWAAAAAGFGIDLDPTLPNDVGPVRAGMTGYVATYAQVAARPAVHRARVGARRTLAILDEIHHAGDGLSWGAAVADAFGEARRRLSLTGTPFRTRADERIPFVSYDTEPDGALRSRADVGYGYADALADGVVRPVTFAAYTGTTRWLNSAGEVVAASLTGDNTRDTEAAAWRTALDPRGRWVSHVLTAMDERITHLRRAGMPDAAGIVLASDVADARAYAGVVTEVTGRAPVVVTSDDPAAGARLARFAAGTERIVVCVRMISEGVDIPRAACLAWLTSYRTPLFFAQAVGRVVRSRRPGESATVFLPAVRPLLALAAELETERNHVTPAPPTAQELPEAGFDVAVEAGERSGGQFEALESAAEFAHVLSAGRAVVAAPVGADDVEDDFLGLPGLLSPEQTASLLARRDVEIARRVARPGPGRAVPDPVAAAEGAAWEQVVALRREVNRLVGAVAARTGEPHSSVHSKLRRAVPGPPSAAASLDILAARRDRLRRGL
jgi:superfamily II DNA or RNA helicase